VCGEMLAKVFGDVTAAFHNIGSYIGEDGDEVILDILHALGVELHVSLGGFHEDLVIFFFGVPELLLVLAKRKRTL
jgi:hypothetical protein